MEKILLVEDEKMVADVIQQFFDKHGFQVDVAYDLESGMEKSNGGYDLFLLDINLREDTSFPILKKIKEDDPKAVCLMFSGYDSEENILEAKGLGADGFIPKPFRIEFLKDFLLPKIESLRKRA